MEASSPVTFANQVAVELDADVLLYSGRIDRENADKVFTLCLQRKRRTNIVLIMTTGGGDPNAAYWIARVLQQMYKKFYFLVLGYCKSAGTLVALGAHELIFCDFGELGPLDIQLRKDDEFVVNSSGLTLDQAFISLDDRVRETVKRTIFELKVDLLMTTRTAAEVAAKIVTGLYSCIYAQIDPMRLGEMQRALTITLNYGRRLEATAQNNREETLATLVQTYPDHGFVIDREEARHLFKNVKHPEGAMAHLAQALTPTFRQPTENTLIFYLNEASHDSNTKPEKSGSEGSHEEDSGNSPAAIGGNGGNSPEHAPADPPGSGTADAGNAVDPEAKKEPGDNK